MNQKIGFILEDFNKNIWLEPRPKTKPKFSSSWQLTGSKLSESLNVFQIDNKYLFSNCLHVYHTDLILSKNDVIDWPEAFNITVYLSFLFDTPIFVHGGYDSRIDSIFFKNYVKPAGAKGFKNSKHFPLVQQFHEDQKQIIDHISSSILGDAFQRDLSQYESRNAKKIYGLHTLKDKKLNNALYAYYEALSSSSISGQILNLWRSIEASTTEHQRRSEFEDFLNYNFLKIKVTQNNYGKKDFSGNLISRYRKIAKSHLEDVKKMETNGNPIEYFYNLRRHPIAHADKKILKFGLDVNYSTLILDSILLKLVARMFIEKKWKKLLN